PHQDPQGATPSTVPPEPLMPTPAKTTYEVLPSVLRDVAFSAYQYRSWRRRFGGSHRATLALLAHSPYWSPEDIQSYQLSELRSTLTNASEHVPHYRSPFDRLRLRPDRVKTLRDLEHLPVLSKAEVLEDPTRFLNPAARPVVRALTGGTTGSPLHVWLTLDALQWQWAVWRRHRMRF